MKGTTYNHQLMALKYSIEKLPTSELRYQAYLLLAILVKHAPDDVHPILEAVQDLTEKSHAFLISDDDPDALVALLNSYEQLVYAAGTRHYSVRLSQFFLHLIGGFCAAITGTLGALIGGVAGLARSLFEWSNPFYHLRDGLLAGLCLGAALGFRSPKKLLKDNFLRQLKFCLDDLGAALNHLQQPPKKSLAGYLKKISRQVLRDQFNNDEECFSAFLEADIDYEIASHKAQFISKNLKGYIGHHRFIKLKIGDKTISLEFSLGQSDLETPPFQQEPRCVKGQKILEMMAYHKQLMETHRCNLSYIITKMKPGEVDCGSYVRKLIIGSGQKPPAPERFETGMNVIGRGIGFFVTHLSALPQDILQAPDQTLPCQNALD